MQENGCRWDVKAEQSRYPAKPDPVPSDFVHDHRFSHSAEMCKLSKTGLDQEERGQKRNDKILLIQW